MLANEYALPAALDYAQALPAAEDTADGEEGGAGHLGDVLAGEGEVYQHATLYLLAYLPGEAEQGMGNAPFDTLGGKLAIAVLELLQAARQEAQRIQGETWKPLHQPCDNVAIPGESDAGAGGLPGGGVERIAQGGYRAKRLAWADDTHKNLVAFRGKLGELDPALYQYIQHGGRVALVEEVSPVSNTAQPCSLRDNLKLRSIKPLKEVALPEMVDVVQEELEIRNQKSEVRSQELELSSIFKLSYSVVQLQSCIGKADPPALSS